MLTKLINKWEFANPTIKIGIDLGFRRSVWSRLFYTVMTKHFGNVRYFACQTFTMYVGPFSFILERQIYWPHLYQDGITQGCFIKRKRKTMLFPGNQIKNSGVEYEGQPDGSTIELTKPEPVAKRACPPCCGNKCHCSC